MTNPATLIKGQFYHILNRGINGCNLFAKPTNYAHFMGLYEKYISPIAETYAWVLMPNHFHFLVRIREDKDLTGFENLSGLMNKPTHQHFSNLFNAYTKAFNKYTDRTGALFQRPFKRKLIDNVAYLKQVLVYIHQNPVHHGYCESPLDYRWSSYLSVLSEEQTKLERELVRKWFETHDNYKIEHNKIIDPDKMGHWLQIYT